MFVSNALLSTTADNFFTHKLSHQKRVTVHWILQVLGLVSIMLGASAIYINKERNGYEHFQSRHSTFGLICYFTMFAGMFGGSLANYSQSFKKFVPPSTLKGGHTVAGAIAYAFFIFTLCSGIYYYWDAPGVLQVKIAIFSILGVTTFIIASKSFKKGMAKINSKPIAEKAAEKSKKVK